MPKHIYNVPVKIIGKGFEKIKLLLVFLYSLKILHYTSLDSR